MSDCLKQNGQKLIRSTCQRVIVIWNYISRLKEDVLFYIKLAETFEAGVLRTVSKLASYDLDPVCVSVDRMISAVEHVSLAPHAAQNTLKY